MAAEAHGEQEELVPKSSLSHYDTSEKDRLVHDAPPVKNTDVTFVASLNEDRLVTVCEQLSDLRLMIKRLENLQAGIQMPAEKSKSAYGRRRAKTSDANAKTPKHDNHNSPFSAVA